MCGLPGGIAARRFLSEWPGLGVSAGPTRYRTAKTDTRLFAESIRKNCRRRGALTIDHVMPALPACTGFPTGSTPRTSLRSATLRGLALRILALEAPNHVVVVGEDLEGEPAVRDTLARSASSVAGVLLLEERARRVPPVRRIPGQALVSLNPRTWRRWRLLGGDRHRGAPSNRDGSTNRATGRKLEIRRPATSRRCGFARRTGIVPPELLRCRRRLPRAERGAAQRHRGIPGAHRRRSFWPSPGRPQPRNWSSRTCRTTWQFPIGKGNDAASVENVGDGDPQAAGFTAMFANWM